MRYLSLAMLLLLLTLPARATLSVVQCVNNENTAGIDSCVATATSGTCNNALAATTTGNLLVVATREGRDNTSTVVISDSASGSWTQFPVSGYQSSSSSSRFTMFYKANSVSVTSVDATWTNGASTRISITMCEIAGAATSSPLDSDVGSTNTGSVTSITSGSLTTTNANDILIFAGASSANQTSWTNGSNYTIQGCAPGACNISTATGSANRIGIQFRIVSATQSGVTTSISDTGAGNMASVFGAFKAAGAGAAATPGKSVIF